MGKREKSAPLAHFFLKSRGGRFAPLSWFFCFLLVFFLAVYSIASEKKKKTLDKLKFRHENLLLAKAMALKDHSSLVLQIESQNDPEWVQLVLKRKLGLVPEGQEKVFFETSE